MKVFHLSDLHIGLKLINRDLSEDQRYVFAQIARYAKEEKPDAILIAGDIYDKAVPGAEAMELFDDFLGDLKAASPDSEIMIVSGNHDSAPRVNMYRGLLGKNRVHMIGNPPATKEENIEKMTLTDEYGPVNFYLLPFIRPTMAKGILGTDENGLNFSYDETIKRLIAREEIDTTERNVIVSHQFYLEDGKDPAKAERMDNEILTVGNIDRVGSSVLDAFDYGALGHIHKPMTVGRDTLRYCGTPLACSVSEEGQEKGVVVAELRQKGDIRIRKLPLVPLRKILTVRGTLEEVTKLSCADYVRVVLSAEETGENSDTMDRLRNAFPNLLKVEREEKRLESSGRSECPEIKKDPYELCCDFLGETDEETKELLREIVNSVREEYR